MPLQPLRGDDPALFKKPYAKQDGKPFLFEFFKEWAINNNFSDVIRLIDVKSDQDFIDNLKKAWLFKDPAFGGEFHGAWTHLIQWYCIASAYQAGDISLSQPPSQILRAIGENAGDKNFIWDQTLETPISLINGTDDFRNVVTFNKFINHDEAFGERCPTLQALIRYRALKDEQKLYSPGK